MATFNPAETGLHGPYITRKMRRKADREKPVAERAPKNTLGRFMASVAQTMPRAKVSQHGYRGGARMVYEFGRIGKRLVAAFRHPTKAATQGRTCSVTVTP